jgi:hypothetical protein
MAMVITSQLPVTVPIFNFTFSAFSGFAHSVPALFDPFESSW